MPEGDSVWRLSERMQPLVGREVTYSQFRVPQLATADLAGERIERVWPHGKHLFWLVGDRVLHTHLRMDGIWRIHAEGTRWSAPAHTARVVVRVEGGVELVGHDLGIVELWPAREFESRMGWLGPDLLADDWAGEAQAPEGRDAAREGARGEMGQVGRSSETARSDDARQKGGKPAAVAASDATHQPEGEPAPVAPSDATHQAGGEPAPVAPSDVTPQAGNEPPAVSSGGLGPRWRPSGRAEALRRLAANPGRTLGEALLDQRNLAGIGNEYCAEVCFLRGLHPASRIGAVDVEAVVDLAWKLMHANLSSPVRTFTGDHRRGHTTFVFGRAHRPCLRCGTAIEKSTLGGADSVADPRAGMERIIWWCPRCQRVAG
ncbi:hypothetical protein BW730_02130 [Tessaracoccus aquimaris]|uniref:DNA-(apurinic or apyrimidinic site) lyase n=1 Tax=Tessaracoccus aquimaris TaxID=1332264 RepID=A0A1Q2CK78_9ACTN|nr:DNA-formamidopyrimidine glycosylase family protein [Tessaracoccus aquimaris]AQP46517.1 hypothetical protein BW730_02130 [Tessaracoccus aquimaris]